MAPLIQHLDDDCAELNAFAHFYYGFTVGVAGTLIGLAVATFFAFF